MQVKKQVAAISIATLLAACGGIIHITIVLMVLFKNSQRTGLRSQNLFG